MRNFLMLILSGMTLLYLAYQLGTMHGREGGYNSCQYELRKTLHQKKNKRVGDVIIAWTGKEWLIVPAIGQKERG